MPLDPATPDIELEQRLPESTAKIRLLGDIAIIHGRTVYRKPDGQAGAGRYIDVYACRQGRWLCVCADVTRG